MVTVSRNLEVNGFEAAHALNRLLAASVSWYWSSENEGRAVEVLVPGI